MVAQYGLTPAEAVDYHAIETDGYSQKEWATKRGLEGHQSVGRNVREARKKLKDPRNIIDTVMVDPDDVIEAIRFNNQPPEYKNQRSAVLRITPPFDSESTASIHYSQQGNHYPPESTHPIHINPGVFVGEVAVDLPIRGDERARAHEMLDDPTDEEIDEFVQQAFDVWEEHARKALVDETDINDTERSHGDEHVVSVRYE